jgi:hypothetical protein
MNQGLTGAPMIVEAFLFVVPSQRIPTAFLADWFKHCGGQFANKNGPLLDIFLSNARGLHMTRHRHGNLKRRGNRIIWQLRVGHGNSFRGFTPKKKAYPSFRL